MYMHIYVNFYDWLFNGCTGKSVKSIQNIYQRQNTIKTCDQLFTIFNMQQTTYYAPTNMHATHKRTKNKNNKVIFQLITHNQMN